MALVFAEPGGDNRGAGRGLWAREGWDRCPSRQRGGGSGEAERPVADFG